MYKTLNIVFCLFFSFILFGQNKDSDSSKKLDSYYNKIGQYYYTNKDSVYKYYDLIKENAKKHDFLEHYISALIGENYAASYYYDLNKIKNNLQGLDSLYSTRIEDIKKLESEKDLSQSLEYSKGTYYFEIKDFKQSRVHFERLINSLKKNELTNLLTTEIDFLSVSYSFLAKMYTDEGKFNLAKELYKKNLHLINTYNPTNVSYINSTYNLLAEVHLKENNFSKANFYTLKAFQYYSNNTKNTNSIVTTAENLTNNYIQLKNLDSAKFYLGKMKDVLPENHPFWYRYHLVNSNVLKAENNYPEAIQQLNNSLILVQEKWNNKPHNDVVEIYNKFGTLYTEASNPEKAIEYYNLALKVYESNPIKSTINKITILKTLKGKANALNQIYNYEEAIKTVDEAVAILDDLKPTFKDNTDKLFLIENAFPLFESGIKAAFNLYKTSEDEMYSNKAFLYAEKSKAVLLLESLLSVKATEFANIPKTVIEEELLIKSQITHLEKQLNSKKTEALEDELFKLKTKHIKFIETLESKYKNYYDLKYNTKVTTIKDTKKLLSNSTMLLSYFYGETNIYTIAVSKNNTQIIETPIASDFKNTINTFQKQLSDPNSNVESLKSLSHVLFESLLRPINIPENIKNLVIITDGVLNYIPFSALIDDGSNYIIHKYATSYVNSATLLKQLQSKKENNGQLLAFAPEFNTTNKLLPLPNNKKEANNCLLYFKGRVLENDTATLTNFNAESSNYSILHLATHAIFNDETPEFSFLAFTPQTNTDSVLYTKDLYNLKLNSDLVTLSACESGIGDLKRGEGLLSLARGFYFSGANSISSTLWKINDASSTKIMNHFYANLAEGKDKQDALQDAQLKFITNNKDTKLTHPYYWSGIIISGNTTPVVTNSNWMWWIIGVLALVIIGFIIKKQRTS
ncbi:CHAT domain-containing protein [Lacinutrix salivirga]